MINAEIAEIAEFTEGRSIRRGAAKRRRRVERIRIQAR